MMSEEFLTFVVNVWLTAVVSVLLWGVWWVVRAKDRSPQVYFGAGLAFGAFLVAVLMALYVLALHWYFVR